MNIDTQVGGMIDKTNRCLVQMRTVRRLNDITPEYNGRVRAETVDGDSRSDCQDDTGHGPATVFVTIAGEGFELCVECGATAVRKLVEDGDSNDLIDVEVYR